jgi:hypothetical protein
VTTAHASTVEQTATCETGQHYRCAGTIVSLTATNGAPCKCPCHAGGD